jgi:hypothetical protein
MNIESLRNGSNRNSLKTAFSETTTELAENRDLSGTAGQLGNLWRAS